MKIQTIIAAGLLVILSFPVTSSNAQAFDAPAVKILPTTEKGILKVHYAYHTDQAVNVRFFDNDGVIATDKVLGPFTNGFSKKYDVRKMASNFWIEVTTENLSVTYKLIPSDDHKTYVPVLEKTAYNHSLVASNN